MKKMMFIAAMAALMFASCNNRQQDDNYDDGMGAGDGTDTAGMYQDTSTLSAPVDTATDTTTRMP